MSYQVSATDLENIRLNELETVNAVLQNIALILATPKAIETWEPRAAVRNVSFAQDPLEPGKLIPAVEVEIVAEG